MDFEEPQLTEYQRHPAAAANAVQHLDRQLMTCFTHGPFRKMWDMDVKIIFLKKLHFGS